MHRATDEEGGVWAVELIEPGPGPARVLKVRGGRSGRGRPWRLGWGADAASWVCSRCGDGDDVLLVCVYGCGGVMMGHSWRWV